VKYLVGSLNIIKDLTKNFLIKSKLTVAEAVRLYLKF